MKGGLMPIPATVPHRHRVGIASVSVARMFRGLGTGYQGVINRVLRVWMQCKIAGWLDDEVMLLQDRRSNIFRKQLMSGASYRDWPGYGEDVMKWAEARLEEE